MFYRQSWLLVHFLRHGWSPDTSIDEAFQEYEASLYSGASEADSFAAAFGIEPSELNEVLRSYLDSCCMGLEINVEAIFPEYEAQPRRMTKPEAAMGLVWLSGKLDQGNSLDGRSRNCCF